jgi:nitrogen-specific signal transduction histidine kinase
LDDFYRIVLDGLQLSVLIVEQDARIVDSNATAAKLLATDRMLLLKQRPGEALHCLHSTDVTEGCGKGPACTQCVIRNSVNQSLHGQCVTRQKIIFETLSEGEKGKMEFLVTTSPLEYADHKYVLLVLEDIAAISQALQ